MRSFVGREAERTLFCSALHGAEHAFAMLYVHGPGGSGKTTLLRVFADDARAAGRSVVEIDVRVTGANPAEFEAACGSASTTGGVILLIDNFEQSQALETWLRTRYLPQLPYDAMVVIAGRLPLDPGWRTDPDWNDALRVITLPDLNHVEARALLAARGVPEALYGQMLDFAGGHPLALTLAADLAAGQRSAPGDWAPAQEVVTTLLHRLVGHVPSPVHRRALEVCAQVEVTTEELLRSAVGHDAAELFEWLRELPFIESGRYGVHPHDVVREALTHDLRWRDPAGFNSLHRGLNDHLLERVRAATGPDVIEATRSLLYLYRHARSVEGYVTWTGRDSVYEDDYRPNDRAAVLQLTTRREGADGARIVAFWLDRQPEAFHLHRRTATGEITGFSAWLRLRCPDDAEMTADPVVAAIWRYCGVFDAPRPDEHIVISRFKVDDGSFSGISPTVDLMVTRALAEWVRAEQIAWSVLVIRDIELWGHHAATVDHNAIGEPVTVGGHEFALYGHDWRLVPRELWLRRQHTEVLTGRPACTGDQQTNDGLSRPQFDAAVRAALRQLDDDSALDANPLCRMRLVDTGHNLRGTLTEAVRALADDPRAVKLHRAVHTTYFLRVPTQERAAKQLGLPFSTYRRHLTAGIESICEALWKREFRTGQSIW
jgi:hypothetical protein